MKDYDDHRSDIVDSLMDGETVAGFCIQDILDGEFELAHRLAAIWKRSRPYQHQAYDDLEALCRRTVERYVRENLDEEVTRRLESAREDHDEYDYAENL